GIRFSGKKLGRPPKEMDAVAREMERLRLLERGERNEVEGKIGTAKTRYGLGKLMTKTEQTSENWVAMAIFSMNMATALRRLLLSLFYWVKNWVKIVTNLNLINSNPKIVPIVSW
ncbi:MAG: transposase, partial [Candidatus Marinimicrobia bacterium]|nr:transposase [Candidatus Neomarinimicrobiota bacterium]